MADPRRGARGAVYRGTRGSDAHARLRGGHLGRGRLRRQHPSGRSSSRHRSLAPRSTAGDPVGATLLILDGDGKPALDRKGHPLTDKTHLLVSYEAPESFATDASGQVIAAKAGTATVRCAAPDPGASPTRLPWKCRSSRARRCASSRGSTPRRRSPASPTACPASRSTRSTTRSRTHAVARLSPSGAGTTTTATDVTATIAGAYTVTCVVMGAANVTAGRPRRDSGAAGGARGRARSRAHAVRDPRSGDADRDVFDQFGNRVDDVSFAYSATPTASSPAPARFQFAQDGTFDSVRECHVGDRQQRPAQRDAARARRFERPRHRLHADRRAERPVAGVHGPAGAGDRAVPVRIGGAFAPQTVTIAGTPATFDGSTGNYEARVPIGFGMNFVDVVATDGTACRTARPASCSPGVLHRRRPRRCPARSRCASTRTRSAIPTRPGSTASTTCSTRCSASDALRQLVDQALVAANPINDGGCGVFACEPDVTYNRARSVGHADDDRSR